MANIIVRYFYKEEVKKTLQKYFNATKEQIEELWQRKQVTIDSVTINIGVGNNSSLIKTLLYLITNDTDKIKTGLITLSGVRNEIRYKYTNIIETSFYDQPIKYPVMSFFITSFLKVLFGFMIISCFIKLIL